jgi:excisionase family DNA binding protein
MTTVTSEVWLTCRQVADAHQVSVQTIRRRIADGTLEAKHLGRNIVRINPRSVDAWRSTEPTEVAS